MLGAAAGLLFGLSAALTKATVGRFDGGLVHVVADCHIWALAVVGYSSMALDENSLQVGPLAPAIATHTTSDPRASLALGFFAFHTSIHGTAAGVTGAPVGPL